MPRNLDFKNAHRFVRDQRGLGVDIRWDGWDIVLWKPTHHGWTNPKGAFRNNRWGVESRFVVNSEGIWKVPQKNVKNSR
jgi:hypothetical protein